MKAFSAKRIRERRDDVLARDVATVAGEGTDHRRDLGRLARLDARPRPAPQHERTRAQRMELCVRVVDDVEGGFGRLHDALEERLGVSRATLVDHPLERCDAWREHRPEFARDPSLGPRPACLREQCGERCADLVRGPKRGGGHEA
jgi:hypothetical protein